jgi:hypothetical protein
VAKDSMNAVRPRINVFLPLAAGGIGNDQTQRLDCFFVAAPFYVVSLYVAIFMEANDG